MGLLDIDESGGRLRAFDADGELLLTTLLPHQEEDNGWQRFDVDLCGVAVLEIELAGSGAVTDLVREESLRRGRISDDDPRGGRRARVELRDRRGGSRR
ncbi:MAG: hypothetical protein AAF533_15730 [Acidobacteriota bacterium]